MVKEKEGWKNDFNPNVTAMAVDSDFFMMKCGLEYYLLYIYICAFLGDGDR